MPPEQKLIDELTRHISELVLIPIDEIRSSDTLSSLGLDSASIISLSAHVEESYGVKLGAEDFSRGKTIDAIAETIRRSAKGL